MNRKLRNIKNGIKSFWYWRKIIWNNRWWDYGYLLYLIEHQLRLMADNWDKSHYVGSEEEKAEIEESLRLLEELNNTTNWDMEQEWFEEFIDSLKVMRKWWD